MLKHGSCQATDDIVLVFKVSIEITGLSVWQEKSKLTNLQKPLMNLFTHTLQTFRAFKGPDQFLQTLKDRRNWKPVYCDTVWTWVHKSLINFLHKSPPFLPEAIVSLAGAATSIIFLATKFCCNKHTLVATKHILCCDKTMPVATNIILAAPTNDITNITALCWHNAQKTPPVSRHANMFTVAKYDIAVEQVVRTISALVY